MATAAPRRAESKSLDRRQAPRDTGSMGRRTFVSYSRKDRAIVGALADGLRRSGFDVWMDRRLDGGQDWWDEVLSQIAGCDYFVLAFSPNSVDSVACQRELDYALDLERAFLPVEVEAVYSEVLLDERLGRTQRVRFEESDDSILDVVRSLLGLPDAPAAPQDVPRPKRPISYVGRLRAEVHQAAELPLDRQRSLASQLVDLYETPELQDPTTPHAVVQIASRMVQRPDVLHAVARTLERRILDPARLNVDVEPLGDRIPVEEPAVDEPTIVGSQDPGDGEGPESVVGEDVGESGGGPESVVGESGGGPESVVGESGGGPESVTTDEHVHRPVDRTPGRRHREEGRGPPASSHDPERRSGRLSSYVLILAGVAYGTGILVDPLGGDFDEFRLSAPFVLIKVALAGQIAWSGFLLLRAGGGGDRRSSVARTTGALLLIVSFDLAQFIDGFTSDSVSIPGAANEWAIWIIVVSVPFCLAGLVAGARILKASDEGARLSRRVSAAVVTLALAAALLSFFMIVASDRFAFPWVNILYLTRDNLDLRAGCNCVSGAIALTLMLGSVAWIIFARRVSRDDRLQVLIVFSGGAAALFLVEFVTFAPNLARALRSISDSRMVDGPVIGSNALLRAQYLIVGCLLASMTALAFRQHRTGQ